MKDSAAPRPTILILGGSAAEREEMDRALGNDFDCVSTDAAGEAWRLMSENFVQVAICAGNLDGANCIDVFGTLVEHWPETRLVTVADKAGEARDLNVHQVLVRPWAEEELRHAIASAARIFGLMRENERLALEMRCLSPATRPRPREAMPAGFDAILRTPASPLVPVIAAARQFASFDVPVLILGEAGSGRSDLARGLHDNSLRSDKPFVELKLAGLSDEAIALTLFGSRRAPNGASRTQKTGLVRKADQGTLYLSGVEGLSHALQLRLIRLLRDGTFEQEDAPEPQASNVRVIASTGLDPQRLLEEGFDEALYYALSVAELAVPPLRRRPADIAALAHRSAEAAAHLHRKAFHGFSDAALDFLCAYDWPGNLSELRNEVTRMLILSQEPVLGAEVISRRILQASPVPENTEDEADIMADTGPLKDRIEAIEARILRETLTRLRWNKSRSAAELGLSRVGLRNKLDRYGIAPPQAETEEA